jgi:arylsulfatase A-like enzyme
VSAPSPRPPCSAGRDALYWHYPHYGNQGSSPGRAVRCGPWKLIEFYEDGHHELYNLDNDLGEPHDPAQKHPDKAAELYARLTSWRAEVHARMPTANPNRSKAEVNHVPVEDHAE